MAGFEITKVIKEFHPIEFEQSEGGVNTFGRALDELMGIVADSGGIVQTIALQVEEAEWAAFCKARHPQSVGISSDDAAAAAEWARRKK